MMQAYEYTILYKPGMEHATANALSRCPVPDMALETCSEDRILLMEDIPLVTAENIRPWTAKDPILARVQQLLLMGGVFQKESPEFKPYATRQTELCAGWLYLVGCSSHRTSAGSQGCLAAITSMSSWHISYEKPWRRVISGGRSWMTTLRLWQKAVQTCQEHMKAPANAPLHPWEWPEKPWKRIHIDYAGPFLGHMFLILVNAHSKWMDVYLVSTASSGITIDCLRKSFSNHGLPEMLVSDNAAYFVSTEFKEFMNKNGIRHVTSDPFHASSNGLAERAVQTFKNMMKKAGGGECGMQSGTGTVQLQNHTTVLPQESVLQKCCCDENCVPPRLIYCIQTCNRRYAANKATKAAS